MCIVFLPVNHNKSKKMNYITFVCVFVLLLHNSHFFKLRRDEYEYIHPPERSSSNLSSHHRPHPPFSSHQSKSYSFIGSTEVPESISTLSIFSTSPNKGISKFKNHNLVNVVYNPCPEGFGRDNNEYQQYIHLALGSSISQHRHPFSKYDKFHKFVISTVAINQERISVDNEHSFNITSMSTTPISTTATNKRNCILSTLLSNKISTMVPATTVKPMLSSTKKDSQFKSYTLFNVTYNPCRENQLRDDNKVCQDKI